MKSRSRNLYESGKGLWNSRHAHIIYNSFYCEYLFRMATPLLSAVLPTQSSQLPAPVPPPTHSPGAIGDTEQVIAPSTELAL